MNLKLSFSFVGIIIFSLPIIINIFYVIFPPKQNDAKDNAQKGGIIEIIENVSRIAYLAAVTLLVSQRPLRFTSPWLYIAAVFLALYYAAWIRYFASGSDVAMLFKSFLFVPLPLAVFPVLYFLFCAIWMHNIPAAAVMTVFGAAHITVTYRSFKRRSTAKGQEQ